jgi:hypothetical protein
MKKYITALAVSILMLVSTANTLAYDPAHSLHSSRASFLMKNNGWMTLNYLHPNANKGGYIAGAKNNGDTHMYIYSRNGGDNAGGFELSKISPQADWEAQIQTLINSGLKPVMWLTPDDSPGITGQPIDAQKAHFNNMVARFDNQIEAYVVCLECDEYWSAATVNELVRHLKTKTDKPVAVHMTSGVGGHRGNLAYYKGADYVFLQTGWNRSGAEIQAMVKDAIARTGLPVVLSEYAKESRSASARAMGDAGCAAGAVGTGNGRSITLCGQEPQPIAEPKDKNNNYAYIAAALVAVGVFAYIGTNYDITFDFQATDEMSMFAVKKTFQLTERQNLNFSWQNAEKDSDDQQRFLLSYNFDW